LYDYSGRVFILYDHSGRVIILYDHSGRVLILYDHSGRVLILYDHSGRVLILYDLSGRVFQVWVKWCYRWRPARRVKSATASRRQSGQPRTLRSVVISHAIVTNSTVCIVLAF